MEPEALSEEMMGVWRQVALAQPYFEATSRMNMCAFRGPCDGDVDVHLEDVRCPHGRVVEFGEVVVGGSLARPMMVKVCEPWPRWPLEHRRTRAQ